MKLDAQELDGYKVGDRVRYWLQVSTGGRWVEGTILYFVDKRVRDASKGGKSVMCLWKGVFSHKLEKGWMPISEIELAENGLERAIKKAKQD
jgi:hypothetical protein